jgi:hypothetical protein
MAGVYPILFNQSFSAVTQVTVTHNLGRRGLVAKPIIGGEDRTDLVDRVAPTVGSERDEFTVYLTSSQSGEIQVLGTDTIPVETLSPENAAVVEDQGLTQTPPAYFNAYDLNSSTDISAGWTTVPLNTVRRADAEFDHTAPSGEVAMGATATHEVHYYVTTDLATGTSRTECESRLMLNGVEVPGTRGLMYNRTGTQGGTSATVPVILDLTIGDVLRVEARRLSGGSTTILRNEGSGLVIIRR